MSLITLGTVALDNLKTPVGDQNSLLGGSASHFALSASHFTDVHIASVVGEDFPKEHYDFLKNKKIDLSSLIERTGNTFRWVGEYKEDDLNQAITLETDLGVLPNYSPQIAFEQAEIPYVFLANFDPDLQLEFLRLMKKPKLVGLDTMNLWIDIKRQAVEELIGKVDLFILNDGEAKMLTEESNTINAGKKLLEMGPKHLVIKKGEHGVLYLSQKDQCSFAAYPVTSVVDPTGAGDTFAGGLMGTLAAADGKITSEIIRQALHHATVMASFNVEAFGMGQTAELTKKKIDQRLKEYLNFIDPQV